MRRIATRNQPDVVNKTLRNRVLATGFVAVGCLFVLVSPTPAQSQRVAVDTTELGGDAREAIRNFTATWKRDTVGRLEYVYPSAYRFNRTRAESASTFVDSLADVFNVPRISRQSFFLVDSTDAVFATLGLTRAFKPGQAGGTSPSFNQQLGPEVAAVGEYDRHELTHLVLRALNTPSTGTFVIEGVSTWLGGVGGVSYDASVGTLAKWLNEHPQVTLDSLMRPGYPVLQTYAAAAVVTDIVFDVIGRHGIRLMFDAGTTAPELREGLQRITKYGWQRFSTEWRERVRDHERK